MSDLLLLGCIAALGAAIGIAVVLLADRVSDFFSFYRRQFSPERLPGRSGRKGSR